MINQKLLQTLAIFLFVSVCCQAKLVQVVSLFRHGSRYPLSSIYDGNATRPYWGELTGTGMRQHQTLGDILRKQYIDRLGFLSPIYDRTQVEVYSTCINRTVQSAESQMYGLYPPGTGPKLLQVSKEYYIPPYSNSSDIADHETALPEGYQPIPIKFDQRIQMDDCINSQSEQKKNIELQIDEYNEMNTTYWPFIKRIASVFNITGNVTLATLSTLNSNLECDRYIGRPMPNNFTQEDAVNLKHIDSWYKQFTFVKNLSRAANKGRLEKILGVFDNRIKNPGQALKWTFLSGHDMDIVPLFTDLNLSSSQCIEELYRKNTTTALNCQQYPEFAASLIFELHTDGTTHSVKIRYNGRYMNLCDQKSTECSYQDWRERIIRNLAPDALVDSICGKKSAEEPIDKHSLAAKLKKAYSLIK